MAIYKVYTSQTVFEVTSVEAESIEEAEDIVLNDTGELQWDYFQSEHWQIEKYELQQGESK
jgi:hypothetical protein